MHFKVFFPFICSIDSLSIPLLIFSHSFAQYTHLLQFLCSTGSFFPFLCSIDLSYPNRFLIFFHFLISKSNLLHSCLHYRISFPITLRNVLIFPNLVCSIDSSFLMSLFNKLSFSIAYAFCSIDISMVQSASFNPAWQTSCFQSLA